MTVLITGGSSGIGRAIAQSALKCGHSVHLVARDEARMSKVAAELRGFGPINYSKLDLSDAAAVMDFCRSWSSDLDGLVNNAGYWLEDPIEHLDPHLFTTMLAVNLMAPYLLTKGLLARLRNGGRIVNISSQLGVHGRARFGAYAATKHGLVGLTRCWAPETALRQITVNAVCPGWVNTESNRSELTARARERHTTLEAELNAISSTLTLKRFIEEREVADLVTFLLSEGASGITGQVYEVK